MRVISGFLHARTLRRWALADRRGFTLASEPATLARCLWETLIAAGYGEFLGRILLDTV